MVEYIRRSLAEEAIEEYICRQCKEYNELAGGCISHAMHCPYLSGEEILKPVENEDVQPVNQWISVEENVPDVSGKYLCYLAYNEIEVVYFDRGIEDDEYNNDYPFGVWNTYPSEDGGECREWIEVLEVTHWQHLPEPPKDGEANG